MTTAPTTPRRAKVPMQETPMVLFQNACLLMGSFGKAELWFDANHPLLSASPKNAQSVSGKAQQLGALMEAVSKGWPL
jgi:hypothetical protein